MSVMKKVVFICVCVATVISLCFIYFNRASSLEGLAKANVEALASIPFIEECMSGGEGSTECSHHLTLFGVEYDCSVSCGPGYYACCGEVCKCKKYE